ncbi:MAG: threonine-phosphate decarboxylase [Nitrospirae bacterium]|nr:MAG: threonine-phosphate decarboxylase [Nitrospirota bacterium]
MIWQYKQHEKPLEQEQPEQEQLESRQPEPHGGNIYKLAEELGISEDEIIDFSASINPLGVPKSVVSAIRDGIKTIIDYPDPDARHLRLEIARHLHMDSHYVLCGNGSTELIYLAARALRPEKVLIPAPTFSEYERAVKTLQAVNQTPSQINYFVTLEKDNFDLNAERFIAAMSKDTKASALMNSVDTVFLCNPNNPTGRVVSRNNMLKICNAALKLKTYLVVDEAFIDFCPEESVVKEVEKNPYLIVLRSLTKFYALSGLRIGYAVAHPKTLDLLARYKEPWTVNTLAQFAGIAALKDTSYRLDSLKVIEHESAVIEDGLKLLNIRYFESDANFYLLKMRNAQHAALQLRDKGIMVRDCSNFIGLDENYLRIAVKGNKDNMRLLKELSKIV